MTAGCFDLVIEQGATFLEDFLIEDMNGAVLDLTGCTAAMQVRANLELPPVVSLSTANGGLVIDGPAGTITPVFDTDALVPGRYIYDLKLVDSGGQTFRLLQGAAFVSGEVTTI